MDKINIGEQSYFKSRLIVDLKRVSAPISKNFAGIQKAYASLASKAEFGSVDFKNPDLTYLQGIFVTSGKNLNRDVFLPSEMLKSFPTARLKPININHAVQEGESFLNAFSKNTSMSLGTPSNTIIGSIYDVAFVQESTGNTLLASEFCDADATSLFDIDKIDEDFLNKDKKFHIIIAAALWNFLFPKTIADIVEEIDNGNRALSMENYFLDYDILAGDKIINRKTSPEYDVMYKQNMSVAGSTLGRVCRTILWGGGGLVDNPGNPYGFDYITTSATEREDGQRIFASSASLVEISEKEKVIISGGDDNKNTEYKTRGDVNEMDLDKIIEKLTETNATLIQKNADLNAAKSALEAEKTALESAKASLETRVNELETAKTSLESDLKSKADLVKSLETEKETVTGELNTAKASLTSKEKELKDIQEKTTDFDKFKERATAAEAEVNQLKSVAIVTERKKELESLNLLIDSDTDQSLASLTVDEYSAVLDGRKKIAAASSKSNKTVPFIEGIKDRTTAMSAVASAGASPSANFTQTDLTSLMTKV